MRAKHTLYLSFLSALLLTLSFFSVQAQIPPVASAVGMTGVMKRDHTLTVTYTYSGTNPQSGTIIQWIRYADNCGTFLANIGTGTTTYTPGAADEGMHIGVRVTPRDNAGNLGTPVTYQPWSCTGASPLHDVGPNPVLLYNANCNNASGVGVPIPGNLIINPGGLCSPRSLDWQVEYTGINYRLPGLPARIIINWADGNTETLAPTQINTNETNMSKQLWRVVRNHIYNYDAGSVASTTAGQRCTYTMQATWGIGTYTGVGLGTVTSCGALGFQTQPFTVWDMEDNTALGTHDINHDATSAGVQANPPAPLTASTENVNICQGDTRSIRLADATDFNCTPALETLQPNDQGRWVQFVYGTTSNITAPGGVGGSIIINGVSYSAAQLPVYGRVIWQESPPSVLNPVHITDNIQMPTTGVALQQMTVTMRTWNICNPFDQITSAGNGLSPNQGAPFNVFDFRGSANFQTQAEFPNTNNYFANSVPVTRNYTITIIDKPAPPVAPNRDICNFPVESRQLSVNPVVGGLTYRWYLTQADAIANNNVQATAANFTPTAAQAPAGQRRHFFVTATAGNNCVSDPTEVMLTVRPTLAQPTTITGPVNLCPSSNYSYSLPAPPGTVTITDAITGNFNLTTEFQWTIPAAVGTMGTGQGSESITMTSAAAVGSGNVSVVNRYVTPPATSSGDQCNSTVRNLAVNVRARPTANISPDPANICEGSTILLNGNPSLPAAAAGFTPSISSHTWGGSTTILDATNIQQPTVQASAAPGAYALTYVVTADFGGSVFCSSAVDNSAVNISASPTPASVGANQALCFVAPPLISNALGGSNPGVGTGAWTKVSGPVGVVTFSPSATNPNATATVPSNGVYVFRWTVTNGTCVSSADITVDYGTDPGPQNAGNNTDFCGLAGTLPGPAAVAPTVGSIAWSQVSGPGTTVFGTPTTFNTTVTPSVVGAYTYRMTVTSGTCTSRTDDVVITFNPPATVQNVADFTTCVDGTVLAAIPLSGTFGGGATNAHWERVTGTGTFTSSGTATGSNDLVSPATDSYTPTAADFAQPSPATVQLRLVTEDPAGACPSVNDLVTIRFDKRPANADAGTSFSVCTASTPLSAVAATNGGEGTWTGPAGLTFTDTHSPTTTVSGLVVGANVIRWTVRSAFFASTGGCADTFEDITITRNAVPVNNNQTQQRCVDIPFGSTTVVALTELQALNDAITGIVGSTNRTVTFFEDAGRTDPYDATETLSTGAIVYTRVTRTDVTPACATDGTVTFTINSRPIANFQNPEFCEDMPVGSNTKAGISLTSFNNAVKNGVAANTVAWFTDAARTIAVATPGSVTANNGTRFYARVTNPTTTCTDTTSLRVTLNPIPSPNPLLGPTNVCADPTAATLYQLTVSNPGYTYTWSVPEPPFDIRLGGSSTDDLILLSFPIVVSPGQNISVTETSNKGCVGQPNIKNITVDTSPPAITIVGPSAVCENETGVVYEVANLANTTYAWTVPTGASIISGQGTFRITVNFGIIPGLVAVTPTTTSGCAGNPDDHSVAINPRPSLDLISNSVCSDNIAGITLSGTDATSYDITSVAVQAGLSPSSRASATGVPPNAIFNDVFTNSTGGPLVVQYTIVPVSALGCKGDSRVVNLFVQPEPVLDPTLADEICSSVEDVNITLKVATGSFAADQYEITSVNVPVGLTPIAGNPTNTGIFTASVLLDDRWENLTAGPLVVEYFVRPRNSGTGCVGDPAIPVRVTVNPEPQVAPASETICSGDAPTITLTTSPLIAGSTFAWTVKSITGLISGASNGTGANITNILVNNDVAAGSVTYEVRATGSAGAGGCLGPPTDVTITVNPAPLTNNVDQIVCSTSPGGNTFTENLIALQPGINSDGSLTFTWHTSFADADAGINAMTVGTASAFPLANGVPVFVRVDNTICARVQAVTYTVHPTPSFTAAITSNYNGAQLSCATSSNGIITVTPPTNGTSPYLYSIDGGSSFFTSTTFNGLSAAGNPYVVRVRDARGCVADAPPLNFVAPLALTATTAITSNFNGQHIECRGDNNGEVTVTPAGGTGAKTFSIQELPGNLTGATTGIFTGLTAGTYTFIVRDVNNCQFTTASVTLVDPPAITATAVLTTPVSCNGQADGVITVTASGGTLVGLTYTYTISPGGTSNTTGVFSGLAANTYTVNVEDDNGCIRTSNSVTVTQPSSLTAFASVTSNYNGAKISCPGANNAVITVTANGGNGGFTYVLVESPGNTTGNATGVYTGVGPGTYTVSVTDAQLCNVVTVPVTITDPTPLDASGLVSNVISCNGGSDGEIRISSTGGTGAYTFTMISPAGPSNATGIFSGLAQGTYDFQVRDLNNCTDVVQVILTQPIAVTAAAVVQTPYNGSQISCNGASDGIITVTASGGTGALTYVFDQFPANLTGMTTGVFTGVPPGTGYTFTVRDAKNCPQPTGFVTAPVNVVQPPVITASAAVTSNHNGEDISCPTATDGQITVTASGGTGTLTYRLDQAPLNTSGNATGVYTGVGAGSYTVTVRDANSCFVVTVPVTVTPPPAVSASAAVTSNYNGRQITCNGASDGILTVTAGGGVTPYSYILNEIPGNVTGATSGVFTGLPAGTYTVNVRDLNNCPVVTLPVTISEPTLVQGTSNVTSNYNGQQIRCVGASDGIIRVTGSGGTAPYTFISIEVPGNVTGASTGIFTGLPAGSYTFTVRDANNCTFLTPAVVISPPTPLNATALVTSNYHGSQISCFGANDGTITVTATGGTGALNYVFVENPSNTTGATSGVFVGIGAGGPYTFLVTDANTCNVTTVGVNISQPVAIAASAAITSNHNGQHISCPTSTDGVITVTASGGTGIYVYRLDQAPLNTTGNSTGIYSNVGAGTYTVTVRDENGCFIVTASVTVVPPPPVTATAAVTSNHNGQQISCNGASDGELTVTAGGGVGSYTYLLNQIPANVTGASTGVFTGLPAGTYTVDVRDANNCLVTTTPITITQPAVLGATAAVTSNYNGQQISCNGASDGRIAITVSGGTGPFVYTSVEVPGNVTGASSGIFTGLPAGNYTFTVTDVNSCGTTTAQITISEPALMAATLAVTPLPGLNGRHVSCAGATDGVITVTVTVPGTGASTFTIDQIPTNASGRFSGVFTGIPPGSYTVTVRDANNCTIVTNSVTVDPTPPIIASAAVTKNVNCFAEANGIITVTASGGTGSLEYLLIQDASNLTGASSGVFTGLRAGNYTVRVTDDNTCFVTTTSVTVTQPANLTITIVKMSPYNGFDLSCSGASDGEIRVTATAGGTGPYTYVLDGFPGNTTGATSGIFTGLSAGLYTVTVTDGNTGDPFGPCTRQSLPVFINNPIDLAVNLIGFSKQICIGDDPTPITQISPPVGGIGDYRYQWEESTNGTTFTTIAGATSANFDPPPITQTMYYRRLLSSGPASTCPTLTSDPVEVKVNPLPEIANVTAPQFLCENSAMIVFYDFAPGQAPFFFSYIQETIDQSGAVIATKTVTNEISGDSKPVIQSPFVDDVRITVTGLRDFNGCVANPALLTPHNRYVEVLKNSAAFTATTATQCTGTPFSVQWNANPEVQYTFKWTEGPDAVFGPGLTGPQTDSRVLNSFNTTGIQSLPIILTTTNTLHLSNPAAPDCGVATHLENISIFPTIIPNIVVIEDKLCSGSSVQVTNSTAGGDFHTWTITRTNDGQVEAGFPITDNSALNKSFLINNTTAFNPATYEIRYDISNNPALGNGNCSNSATVTFDVYTEVVAKIGSPKDPVQTIQRWGESDAGDAGVMGVDGSGKNFMRIMFDNASTPAPPAAGIEYTWVFSNNNANTPPQTFPNENADPFFYDYKNPGVGKRATLTVTNMAAVGNVPGGCSDTDQFIFEIEIPPIIANFTVAPPIICLPDTIKTTNLSTPLYNVWTVVNESTGGVLGLPSNDFQPKYMLTEPGRYRISLKVRNPDFPDEDAYYVHAPDQFVDAYDKPFASFDVSPFPDVFVPDQELRTDNRSLTAFDPITDTSWPISYEWDFGDGTILVSGDNPAFNDPNSNHSPTHKYEVQDTYKILLIAYNDHGDIRCSSRDSVYVNAREAGSSKVPNAFTPNPGGPSGGIVDDNGVTINDVFLPITKGVKEFQMQIFDRWGNLVFESKMQNQGWDGYDRNGNLMPAGVYVYKLVLRMSNNQRTTQVGDVTLIR